MDKGKKYFCEIITPNSKVEVWFARELQTVLGYVWWENFLETIGRAVGSCNKQRINVDDYFRDLTIIIS